MAEKVSLKIVIILSLICGILSACMNAVDVQTFIEDEYVQEIVAASKVHVILDPDTKTAYPYLKEGNKKITGLKGDKYYMIESEKDEDKNPVPNAKYPSPPNPAAYPLYVTDYSGPGAWNDNGMWFDNIGVISRVKGGVINALTNDHTYKILEATDFPNGTSFIYTDGGVSQPQVSVTGGKISISGSGTLALINLDSLVGYKVMAVNAVSYANTSWNTISKTVSGSGTTATIPLEGTVDSKVDYVFAKETSPIDFKVLRVEIVPVGSPIYSITLSKVAGSTHNFQPAISGYTSAPPALSVDVTNTGNRETGALTVSLGGTNASNYFTLTVTGGSTIPSTTPGATTNGAFTVQPNTGLAVGTHTATVTVSGNNNINVTFNVSFEVTVGTATVSSVDVIPATASVVQGATQTFSASVIGTNNPSQAVNWTVDTPKAVGTTIDASGLLTVATGETNTTLTVRATSVADATKSGTATVTVLSNTPGITVTIKWDVSDANIIKDPGNPASISYNEIVNGNKSLTFTLDGGTFINVKWYMYGTVVSTNDASITIDKTKTTILANFTTGTHTLYVMGERDGAPFSAYVTFIVSNN